MIYPTKMTLSLKQSGFLMIEVLITIIILTIGLLALAGLQGKATAAELESYQRGQAIILLQDMTDRLTNNITDAANYVTASPLGQGVTDASPCAGTRTQIDLCEWSQALKGASEQKGTTKQGVMIDGRGCIEATGTAGEYVISIVWQGITPTSVPTSDCGKDLYDSENTRRVISTTIRAADLAAS